MHRNDLILLIVSFVLTTIGLTAQPNIEWQKALGGTDNDIAYDVEQTADGGFIVAGMSRSVDGDLTVNHGWRDYWIVKLTSEGTIEWQKTYGGTHHDVARDILQTNDGGYIVAGYSSSEDGQVKGHHGLDDYWIIKLTSDGTMEWERSIGGSGNDFAYAIYQTNDGGYIVGGASDSESGQVTGNHGDYDYWVVKLTNDGSIEWEQSLGGSKSDFGYSIEQTIEGGYIVAGKSHSNDGDVTGNHDVGNFVYDFWVVKLSSTGEIEWQKSLGGSHYESASSVRQSSDGSYIVAGVARSTNGDVTGNHGGWDYWIVKLTNSGELLWQKSLGGIDSDLGTSIQLTNDGGYIATGYAESKFGQVTGNNGGKDFWAVKLTGNGDIDWQKSLGGNQTEIAYAVQQIDDGGYVLAGSTTSNNGDVSGYHGGEDCWIVKLGPCGVNANLEVEEHTIQSLEVALSSTFQWMNCSDGTLITGAENSSFSPENGGDYAVILSNGSCIDTSECISICPLDLDVIVFDNTIQSTEDSPNVTYQWMDCSSGTTLEGETDQTFEPTINGEYAVIITEENCSVTSECATVCPEKINTEVVTIASTIQALADTSSTTFQWINCSTETPITGEVNSTFTATISGDYAVIIKQGACEDISDCVTVCLINTNTFVVEDMIQSSSDPLHSTFQWIDCSNEMLIAGEVSQTFTPTTSGDYAVVVNQGNCVDTSDCVNLLILGLEEQTNRSVNVFPNPVRDLLMVETDAKMLGTNYHIYDSNAKQVLAGKIETTETIIGLNGLPNGVYIIRFKSLKEVLTIRFVKNY